MAYGGLAAPSGRFNSATAFEPWRRGLAKGVKCLPWRFNSATAFEPWRQVPHTVHLSLSDAVASIRPRPLSRGDGPTMRPDSRKSSFNSATAFEPWRPNVIVLVRWQCGGFNSATAFEPWNPRRRGKGAIHRLGFNSATAFEPWRLPQRQPTPSSP